MDHGRAPARVVDLGAGTGKLTRTLVELGHDVVAVEPLEEMLEQLRANVPGVEALTGAAEQIPLPDESADAVVAAQAFHWFDQAVALREIARVLRPGGVLGLIWNARDDTEPWVARLSELTGDNSEWNEDHCGGARRQHAVRRRRVAKVSERPGGRPGDARRPRRLALLRGDDGASRRSRLLDSVGTFFDEVAGGGEELELPYRVYAFRATRL